jgi:hypothetical protein
MSELMQSIAADDTAPGRSNSLHRIQWQCSCHMHAVLDRLLITELAPRKKGTGPGCTVRTEAQTYSIAGSCLLCLDAATVTSSLRPSCLEDSSGALLQLQDWDLVIPPLRQHLLDAQDIDVFEACTGDAKQYA